MYVYIYIERERDRSRPGLPMALCKGCSVVPSNGCSLLNGMFKGFVTGIVQI